jgi:hypothetical protein
MDKLEKSLREAEWELYLMYRSGSWDRGTETSLWIEVEKLDSMIAARDG